jgi:hypothetical protein
MSWRAGAKLFREIWPSVKKYIPEDDVRHEFTRDLLEYFCNCDMDPSDVRGSDPEIDLAIEELERRPIDD